MQKYNNYSNPQNSPHPDAPLSAPQQLPSWGRVEGQYRYGQQPNLIPR
ncbi:MAG: hypothetical protein II670_13220 [Alphaproteobacteria bacterium]|nr:hypothetical protein [Alphaproteobacteria bacterium]